MFQKSILSGYSVPEFAIRSSHSLLQTLRSVFPIADISQSQLGMPVTLSDIPPSIAKILDDEDRWEFNILELEAATHKR